MSLHWYVFSLLFGLISFTEPCSMGINAIFLNKMQQFSRSKRLLHATLFLITRALLFAGIGLLFGWLGALLQLPITSMVLGTFFIVYGLAGLLYLVSPIKFTTIDLFRFAKKEKHPLGLTFGGVIPACSIPLLVALLAKVLQVQSLSFGLFALLWYGVGISLPLILIVYFPQFNQIMTNLFSKVRYSPYWAIMALIIVGILLIFSPLT